MKINCSYCNCSMEATSATCPFCGGANPKAAQYSNYLDQQMQKKRQLERDAQNASRRTAVNQKKALKVIFLVYGSIAFCFILFVSIAIFVGTGARMKQASIAAQQKQEKMQEEQRLKEEQEKERIAYDKALVEVTGINTIAEKDKYYSIQVTDVVPYELNYDHNKNWWTNDYYSDPYLFDNEHRVAIQIKVKNYQDKVSVRNPNDYMGLYICDENENSIVISEQSLLNGSSDDNYYGGGKKISDTIDFIDNYNNTLETNQTMSWWVPVVVNEKSQKIILHFDHNISITIDNPCAK